MTKKRIKQLVSFALSIMMIVAVVGCGSTDKDQNSKAESSVTSSSETKNESTQEVASSDTQIADDVLTYPLDVEDELSVWTISVPVNRAYADYTESPFHTGLAKKTGVEVEWQYPTKGTSGVQAYNLLLTDEVLPDILFYEFGAGEGQRLIEEGIIYDLTEYLPKYAPDYWKVINKPEYASSLKAITTADSKQFCVASIPEDNFNITYMGPIVRKDWLDECGLDIPVTLEDWEVMLKTFKEKYNAKFLSPSGYFLNRDVLCSGVGAYAALNERYYVDDNGKVNYANVQPEWKAYLEVLNRWYENDLIDKDVITIDNTAARAKVLNNEVGASFVPMSQLTLYVGDAEAENTGAEWIGVGYPRVAEGEPTSMIHTRATHWAGFGAVVTTSCPEEKLITALQWLNYGFTEEGNMYWNYGEEGVSYTLNAKGEPEWTELLLNDEQGLSSAMDKYSSASASGICIQNAQLVKMKNNQVSVDAVYKWIENTDAPSNVLPTLALTDEENTTFTDKHAQISAYVTEMALKFFTGEVSLDKFDDYVEQVNKLGLQECIDIQQAAYDRYMAK